MSRERSIHLFNCDRTYKLDIVEDWLEATKPKLGFEFSVEPHYFSLSKMSEMSNETIPGLQMEVAVFVVHAHESRLSINEQNAGIGYAKIYRALLQKTGERRYVTRQIKTGLLVDNNFLTTQDFLANSFLSSVFIHMLYNFT